MTDRYYINHVGVSITDLPKTIKSIQEHIEKGSTTEYICVTNVRAAYIGNHDSNYCKILNNSFLTIPDGKPLEWFAHFAGFDNVKKTSGPDLFKAICEVSRDKGYSHYFYGSSPDVINKMTSNLKNKYPGIKILGSVSPPFKSAHELVTDELINDINKENPTFLWVGLGAPKQEIFIDIIRKKIKKSILIGIGLVFEYEAGTVYRSPQWVSDMGFEWLYIWFQQPKKIIRSYKYFPYFILLLIKARVAYFSKKII
jgi:N-acetylglucosaminyldiphosphoundecaprenol N-acetyl-beta-D-mannosaminyltransferase